MGKALKLGDRYELRYPARASDENQAGSHAQETVGIGCSCGSRRLMRSNDEIPSTANSAPRLLQPWFSRTSDTFKRSTEDFAIDQASVGSSQDVRGKKGMKFEASASSSKTHYLISQPQLSLQLNRWKLLHEFQGSFAVD